MLRTVLGVLILTMLYPVWAEHSGYSGFSETILEAGNTQTLDDEIFVEQWNEVVYTDLNTQREIATQFSVRGRDKGLNAEIYQLYLKQPVQSKILKIGRFDQIDARGYYTLDGVSLMPSDSDAWHFFAGAPKRIEAYDGVDGGWLLGMEKRFERNQSATQLYQFRIGLQQQWDEGSASYLNLGMTQLDSKPEYIGLERLDVSGGLRLDEVSIENFIVKAEFNLEKKGQLYLSYDHFRPPENQISFRDRFYQSYALEQQMVLRSDWHKKLDQQLSLNVEARQVWHDKGSNGYGLAVGLGLKPKRKDWNASLQGDYVSLADDESFTLYGIFKRPLSSTTELELEGMVQHKETILTGKDNSRGLAFSARHLLKKQTIVEGYGEIIHHSDRAEEYRLGVRLRYDFHKLNLPWVEG